MVAGGVPDRRPNHAYNVASVAVDITNQLQTASSSIKYAEQLAVRIGKVPQTYKLLIRCSASQLYVDNDLLNFEALMRIKTNTFITRFTASDDAIIKVLLDNMIAREKMWDYWYKTLNLIVMSQYLVFYMYCNFLLILFMYIL